MSLTFNQSGKRINVISPQTAVDVQTLLNTIRAEEASERGITYDKLCNAVGKDALGGAVATAITLSLLSTWQLEFYAGNYVATIDGGNLVAAVTDAVAYTVGGPQIEIMRSAAATVVSTGGSSMTTDEHNQLMSLPAAANNATAVWAKAIEGSLTAEQMQRILLAALAGKRAGIGSATETYYAPNGTTPRITLTPTDANGNGTPVVTP